MSEMREQVAIGVAVAFSQGLMKKQDAGFRAWAAANMLPGETVVAVDPATGETFGHVTMAKPTRVAYVADEAVLMAHLQDTDPTSLVDVDELLDDLPLSVVIEALKESHPDLVRQRVVIKERVLSDLLKVSERDGKPSAPGIELGKKPGSVRVYPDTDKPSAIVGFIRSGAMPLHYDQPAELPEVEA